MLQPRYATLSPTLIGSALELRDGGLIVTYDTDGATLARHARCSQALATGRHRWEVIVYGDGTLAQVADTASIGLVLADTSPESWPGQLATTVGYRPGDGTCWQSGVSVATVATAPLCSVIRCALDLVGGTPTFKIWVNRLLVHSFALPAGKTWFPAVAIGGTTAYAFSAFCNFGLRAFEEESDSIYRDGVYTSPQPFSTVRLASDDWMTPTTAILPNIAYAGDVNGKGFSIEKAISFWPWSERGGSIGYADIDIDNQAAAYNALVTSAPRSTRLVLKVVDRDDPAASPVPVAAAYIDRPDAPNMRTVRLRLRDALSRLQVPAQKRYFLPYTAEGTQGRPWPISYGVVRSVEALLVDAARRSYVVADRQLTQIGVVREKGDRLDPLASPPDWSVRSDQRGVELNVEPEGKLVLDVSSAGVPLISGAPDTDVLEGFGNMTGVSGGMPAQWFAMTGVMLRAVASRVTAGGGRLRTQTNGIAPAAVNATWDVRFRDMRVATTNWLPIRKGCYYRITWRVQAANWPTRVGFGQFAGGWYIKGAGMTAIAGGVTTNFAPGEYSTDFRAACDGTLAWYGSGNIDPANNGGSSGPWWVEIDDVFCRLKSAVTPDLLNGRGNFTNDLIVSTFWPVGSASGGSSSTHALLTTAEYPAPGLGCIAFTIPAGAGNYAERYCSYATLQAGRKYRVALSLVGSSTNARLRIYAYNTATSARFLLETVTGNASLYEFSATVGGALALMLRGETTDGTVGTVRVSLVRVVDYTDQFNETATHVPLQGIALTAFCRDVIETRAGLGPGAWVPSDAESIDAATGYIFGVHARDAITCDALLRAPLDSFTVALTTDEHDRIRLVRLIDPDSAPDNEIAYDVEVGINTRGDLSYTRDLAPGLTQRAGARRNWSLHSDSDFVADYDPISGIDAAARTRLKRQSQYPVASAQPLAALYEDARDAGPLETLLDLPEHAQAELDRIGALYAVERGFYRVDVLFEGAMAPLRPGQIVRLTWTQAGTTYVRKLLLTRVRHQPLGPSITLTGWGRSYVD